MKKAPKLILLILLALLLVAEICFAANLLPFGPADLIPTEPPTEPPTEAPTEPPTEPPTEAPTEPPTEAPTDPPDVHYTLSFVGDCTLGTYKDKWYSGYGFILKVGEDYDYPFANVREIFENDDLTIANLEGVLADKGGSAASKTFTFRGPTAYTQILTGSSVEAVTLANNHTMDYGDAGYASTKKVLEEAGVNFAEEYGSSIMTLDGGMKVALYALNDVLYPVKEKQVTEDIQKLKEEGAELIIVAIHWGNEGEYRPTERQEKLGKMLIDAGANIVYGHHPHVLQHIEQYNEGIIYYSMGNFCFGGHTNPRDKDSVIIQQEVIQSFDGSVRLGQIALIPCSISSTDERNNYQPTPCEPDSEMYKRVMEKVTGSFDGKNLVVDYSYFHNS